MSNQENNTNPLSYKDAGVDIDAGDALIREIAPHAKRTRRSGSEADLGGFGGLFDLKAAGFSDPVLVAATDGVGTKLELAKAINIHRGLGIDLVAMCANDILAQGALPLFFLDYFATGKLEPHVAADVIAGIADGCIECDCALIGGETAEMPGLYGAGSYDLAGFCVGAAERGTLLAPGQPKAGDIAIGIPSSGVHSNGFSLVRKIIDVTGADLSAPAPFDSAQSLGEALITPTRIYQKAAKNALDHGGVSGIVHVTGGGLIENPPRVYADDLTLDIDCVLYDLPPVFGWLRDGGNMELHEMARTFNCGIGLIIFVSPDQAEAMITSLHAGIEPDATIIGSLRPRENAPPVVLNNSHHWQGK
ncbi:phosphoribosylformylglycinamidine cyclo-ligase [Candidatus Puniceispirillum sp.]|uniref:phosphoribosylformylglycinamidine cyclo-ligase n=1 Tax=Candidatus Puniceispirillum sp. TaxID=2026719 RepID=UPI003F6A047C